MKKTKIIIVSLCFVIAAAFIGFNSIQHHKVAGIYIKVGAILPLTGDFASLAEEARHGIELGVLEAEEKGIHMEVIYEDDRGEFGAASASAANKLANVDKVDVVLALMVEEAKPTAPILSKSKTPLLVLWDSNDFIKQAGPYVFSNGFSTEKAGESMADYAFDVLHAKRIAIVAHSEDWADIIGEAFKKQFVNRGGVIAFEEHLQPSTDDYRSTITKIKQVDIDAVYFPLVPPFSAKFIIQAKQLGLNKTLLTGDGLLQDVINEVGPAAEGIYMTNLYTDESPVLETKYRSRFGTDMIDPTFVSFGYDAVTSVIEALDKDPIDLTKGLTALYGGARSTDKLEKIYKVNKGALELVQ